MTDERIIEEMAGLERYHKNGAGVIYRGEEYCMPQQFPRYLNDHNACQRVIDGMDDADFHSYAFELQKTYFGTLWEDADSLDLHHILKATPRQKCIAILKAYGKWEDV